MRTSLANTSIDGHSRSISRCPRTVTATGGMSNSWRRVTELTGRPASDCPQHRHTGGSCTTTSSGLSTCRSVEPGWPGCPPGFRPDRRRNDFGARLVERGICARRLAGVTRILTQPPPLLLVLRPQLSDQRIPLAVPGPQLTDQLVPLRERRLQHSEPFQQLTNRRRPRHTTSITSNSRCSSRHAENLTSYARQSSTARPDPPQQAGRACRRLQDPRRRRRRRRSDRLRGPRLAGRRQSSGRELR